MWTVENRPRYDRSKLRYPSDLTVEEWSLAKVAIPPAKRGCNKRTVDVREVTTFLAAPGVAGNASPGRPFIANAAATAAAVWLVRGFVQNGDIALRNAVFDYEFAPALVAVGTYLLFPEWNEYLGRFLNSDTSAWNDMTAIVIIYALCPIAIYYVFRSPMSGGRPMGGVKG